jgi:hypothetical protein
MISFSIGPAGTGWTVSQDGRFCATLTHASTATLRVIANAKTAREIREVLNGTRARLLAQR